MVDTLQKTIPIGEVRLDEDDIEAVVAVLRTGNLRQGAVTAEFEREFAAFTGAKHAVAVSSGTAALHLAYLVTLQPGDEVLVPSFTFFATASMVVAAGGKPIFCDVDADTFGLSVEEAEKRRTERTKAVAPVHLFGAAADVSGIQELAGRHDWAIVWDAAQAHGTTYGGQDVGSLPGLTCYSFYPSKNMTTGEGGMITTDDADLATQLRLLRSQGAGKKYVHTVIGYNLRLTDFQAALGLAQLRKLPTWLETRRRNAAILLEAVAEVPFLAPQKVEPGSQHAYHQFSVVVDPARRDDARSVCLGTKGAGSRNCRPLSAASAPAAGFRGNVRHRAASGE